MFIFFLFFSSFCVIPGLWYTYRESIVANQLLSNGSCVDYIRLYEGDMDHPITNELCWVQTMPELKTIQQHIILHVHTDDSIAKSGFKIYYIMVEDYEV